MSTPGDIGLRRYSPDYEKDDLEAENRRLIEAMATALQHLEKGRALWNGPCHQCAYVLRDALGMGEQRALAAEPASGEANDEPSDAMLERGREQALQMLEVSRAGYERGHADALKLVAETAADRAPPPPPTQGEEEFGRKLFYDDRGIYIGDTRAQAIRTLIHALNLAVSRGCDHCAETIRQARALFAAEHTQGSGE